MTIKEIYDKTGNYQDALQRFSNDAIIMRFALKFLNDLSYQKLCDTVKEGNIEDAFAAAHTLKGVAGNVGFTKLQDAAADLTEQLRPLTGPVDMQLMQKVDDAYAEVT